MSFAICHSSFSAPPNIIIFLADDLGYADIGANGCKDIPTPHIDSMARSGVRFTDGYATHCICSPSRAGLMSGRYQHRFGFEMNSGPEKYAADNFGLPRDEPTLAELCGLPKPAHTLEGQSLVPLLRDPQSARIEPAITTWGRNNHAVRTERWRCIHYADGGKNFTITTPIRANGRTSPTIRSSPPPRPNSRRACRKSTRPMRRA